MLNGGIDQIASKIDSGKPGPVITILMILDFNLSIFVLLIVDIKDTFI